MYKKNIAVVGGMRNVNVKVGRLIAEELGMRVMTVEDAIEYFINPDIPSVNDIPSVIRDNGVDYYYTLEEEVVPTLMECNNTVIATTGSMALNPELIERLSEESYIVLLWADDDTTLRRIDKDLRCHIKDDILEKRHSLLRNIREKIAPLADIRVNTTMIMPNEAKDLVIDELARMVNDEQF